jgi:hypothetical protein
MVAATSGEDLSGNDHRQNAFKMIAQHTDISMFQRLNEPFQKIDLNFGTKRNIVF